MGKRLIVACTLLVLLAMPVGAAEFRFDAAFTPGDFETLAEAVADVIVFPNMGPAAPGGVLGFEALAVAGAGQVDTKSHWWRHGVAGSAAGGLLLGPRLVARKGLPARLDLGAQAGKMLGEEFIGAELRWAILDGGMISPAVALRASYSRLSGAPFDLEVAEAQLVISKGMPLLTPYAAVGYRGVEASAFFGDPAPRDHRVRAERVTGAAGFRLSLLPFKLVAEARQGARMSYFVGIGAGL
ncbi:MAG: hypothetical protein V1750_08245 [Acidobacteriota bacterium]